VVGVRERPSPSTAVSAYYLPNVAAAYGAGRPVCGAALVLELMSKARVFRARTVLRRQCRRALAQSRG
jgi:hypothetical protein